MPAKRMKENLMNNRRRPALLLGCILLASVCTAQDQPAPQAAPAPAPVGSLSLHNASLTEVVDMLARQLKINYVIDPSVKGSVILNTYGEIRTLDTKALLERS